MRETGKIVRVNKNRVVVRIPRRDACGSCNACGMGAKHSDIAVERVDNASLGDRVVLEIVPTTDRVFAVIAYLIPLALFVLGFAIAKAFDAGDAVMLIAGFVALAGGFFAAFYVDKRYVKKRGLNPKIIEIIEKEADLNG